VSSATEVAPCRADVGPGGGDIAGLHRQQFEHGFDTAGLADQRNEIDQRFGPVIAEIVDRMWRVRATRFGGAIIGRQTGSAELMKFRTYMGMATQTGPAALRVPQTSQDNFLFIGPRYGK
jgi:hypothetical protein